MSRSHKDPRPPLAAAFEPTPECLSVEEAANFAEGLLDAVARHRAAKHIESCGRCKAQIALYQEFQAGVALPEEVSSVAHIRARLEQSVPGTASRDASPAERRSWFDWPHRWLRASLGAVAALLVGVGISVYYRPSGPPQIDPRGVGSGVLRSGALALVSPVSNIVGAPRQFRWEPVRNALTYRVRLMEVDRTVVWTAQSSQSSIDVPEGTRRQIRIPNAYYWDVAAIDAAGRVIATSNLQNFHTTRP